VGTPALRIVVWLAAGLVAAALAGCGGGQPSLGEDDRSIAVEPGDRFRIELAANPGVGDDWEVSRPPDPAVARLVEDGFESDADEDVVGAPGLEYFVFEAVAPGRTEIELQYCYRGCGSAEGAPLERTATFDVAVEG
jgi:predicted secreted protein